MHSNFAIYSTGELNLSKPKTADVQTSKINAQTAPITFLLGEKSQKNKKSANYPEFLLIFSLKWRCFLLDGLFKILYHKVIVEC